MADATFKEERSSARVTFAAKNRGLSPFLRASSGRPAPGHDRRPIVCRQNKRTGLIDTVAFDSGQQIQQFTFLVHQSFGAGHHRRSGGFDGEFPALTLVAPDNAVAGRAARQSTVGKELKSCITVVDHTAARDVLDHPLLAQQGGLVRGHQVVGYCPVSG